MTVLSGYWSAYSVDSALRLIIFMVLTPTGLVIFVIGSGWATEGRDRRLNKHGLQETEDSISAKLGRGTFAATFFLACVTVMELEGVQLADL